ncbi:hypothetical protein GCM10023116_48500 [Kistimonas scapharcae]|uniref:Uncharacterized protein n=1 Tax=Kistimonas scapharcae TaxID=1036133 RepID=A0ABP8VAZ9_9GAMM
MCVVGIGLPDLMDEPGCGGGALVCFYATSDAELIQADIVNGAIMRKRIVSAKPMLIVLPQ